MTAISAADYQARQTEAEGRTAMIEIRMTPPRECWPNFHGSWRTKAKAVAEFREEAGKATKVAILDDSWAFAWVYGAGAIALDVDIGWPKGQRRLDDDNAIGAMKPARDGIAAVLELDDRKFRQGTMMQRRGEGIVTVTLREIP